MPLYRPSELRAFLADEGVVALQSLSQNFLVDGNIIGKIGDLLDLKCREAILEIGPGPGVVTEYLCAKRAQILTVEKDAAFAKAISRFKGVKSIHADALKIDLGSTVAVHFSAHLPLKVVSNLPYASATAFIQALLPNWDAFSSLTLMLPREVSNKIQGLGKFHWLKAAKEIFCRSVTSQNVSRHCFYPTPKIDSSLVHFDLQSKLMPSEGRLFLQWLKKICSLKKRMGPAESIYHTPHQRSLLKAEDWIDLWQLENGFLK